MAKDTWRIVTRGTDGELIIRDFDSPEQILKTPQRRPLRVAGGVRRPHQGMGRAEGPTEANPQDGRRPPG